MLRYLRLYAAFARVSLLGEMAFRGNFILKVIVEIAWMCLMVFFYSRLFHFTDGVAGWTEAQYFFFLGSFYILESLCEMLFLGNFGEFAELVRTGNLDVVLLKPVDDQFLISTRSVEWSTLPSAFFGLALIVRSLMQIGEPISFGPVFGFVVGLMCALGMAYSFMLMLSATSVWLVRNQSLYEIWWLFMSLMRYPKDIFNTPYTYAVGWVFTFLIPVALAVYVPAASMVKVFEPWLLAYLAGSTLILLCVSRWVFRKAMRSYRSASS